MEGQMCTPCARIKPELLFIDSKRLRQASITRLLDIWADVMGLTVKAVVPDAPLDACCELANCAMTIISVGDVSIRDPQHRALIESLRTLMPLAPLVIISDREDLQEICAAFEGGAVGFMPTSIEPALAFQALTFIRSGGSFFPPSVLSMYPGEATAKRAECALDLTDHASDLTGKQESVLALLRQGHSNKTIARQLGMSEGTVKVHVRRIIHKFGVANRTQLALAAMSQSSSRITANGKELGENGIR
jgi:DNA-binding NarL/FixJ family response regulator